MSKSAEIETEIVTQLEKLKSNLPHNEQGRNALEIAIGIVKAVCREEGEKE